MLWLFGAAIILLAAGWLLIKRGTTLQRETGLPSGRLIYADSHNQDWQTIQKPLYSPKHNLTGKPDYVVETAKGLIPVEVKSSTAPPIPYLGHLLQLAAYCLLIEETHGQAPSHGLLKYANALYEVDFSRELRNELLDTLDDIREAHVAENVARNHNQPGKCTACGFYAMCDEVLN